MIVAMVLARGNSKGIPRKNLKMLAGKPLVSWTIEAAVRARQLGIVDEAYLTTESAEVIELAIRGGSRFFSRPKELSQDHVQSSEVFLFFLRQMQLVGINPTGLVLLAPTSPLRTVEHIRGAVELWKQDPKFSVFSACRAEGYHWTIRNEQALQVDGDPVHRVGRQWRDPNDILWRENGAIYVCDADRFSRELTYKQAPFRIYEMDAESSIDIDDMEAFNRAEQILRSRE